MEFTPSQQEFLTKARIPLRISCILPNGYPLVVSLWFVYDHGKLVCASGTDSKIVKYLRQNSRVGFELAGDTPPYCGLRGYGNANLSEDTHHEVIASLYRRYFQNDDSKLYNFLTDPDRKEMVITITPEQVFDWNFSTRMADSVALPRDPVCP